MGYDHSLITAGTLKPGVTLDQLVDAVQPLFNYRGYDGHKAFNEGLGENSIDEFHWLPESRKFSIYTCGEVKDTFSDLVEGVANNLGPLVEHPSEFALYNHDTGDIDNAKSIIVYGDSEAVIQRYLAEQDLAQAIEKMEKHLTVPAMNQIRLLAKDVLDPLKVEHVSMLQTVESVLHLALLHQDFSTLKDLLDDVKKVNSLQPKAA